MEEKNKEPLIFLLSYIMDECGAARKISYDEITKEIVIPGFRFEMSKQDFDNVQIRLELERRLKEIDANRESKDKDTISGASGE